MIEGLLGPTNDCRKCCSLSHALHDKVFMIQKRRYGRSFSSPWRMVAAIIIIAAPAVVPVGSPLVSVLTIAEEGTILATEAEIVGEASFRATILIIKAETRM